MLLVGRGDVEASVGASGSGDAQAADEVLQVALGVAGEQNHWLRLDTPLPCQVHVVQDVPRWSYGLEVLLNSSDDAVLSDHVLGCRHGNIAGVQSDPQGKPSGGDKLAAIAVVVRASGLAVRARAAPGGA